MHLFQCLKLKKKSFKFTIHICHDICLVQVGIELEAVGLQFVPYRWLPCGVTWDSSQTVVVIKLLQTSALAANICCNQFLGLDFDLSGISLVD